MCGISGFIAKSLSRNEQINILNLMNSSLKHRGPDAKGEWIQKDTLISFGHTRLSIQDLSRLGNQPMKSHSGNYVLSYNGEIYNFRDIKKEIEDLGTIFKTNTDTEVLLASIETWGINETLKKVKGMFAFALWDEAKKKLSIVRDRFGEKPIYYGWQNGNFIFSSEIKSLKKFPFWDWEINRQALGKFMKYSYIPAPMTIYRDIKKLSPGSIYSIQMTSDGWKVYDEYLWWDIEINNNQLGYTYENNIIRLEELLDSAIENQKISDVPVGAFLSGGIDSSLIVSLMQKNSMSPIKTFTIGFESKDYDESFYAKEVANHLKTDHSEYILSSKEVLNTVPLMPHIFDEPFADSSQIPTFLISKYAKEKVSVCLTGDSGDEFFMGYNRYQWAPRIYNMIKNNPSFINSILNKSLNFTPTPLLVLIYKLTNNLFSNTYHVSTPVDKFEKLKQILRFDNEFDIYDSLISTGKQEKLCISYNDEEDYVSRKDNFYSNGLNFENRMMMSDIKNYLHNDILVKIDRAAMSNSLETRIPFLDHDVANFAINLPLNHKLHNGYGKRILRDILYKYVPKKLIERPKSGFGIPIDEWLRNPLNEWVNDTINISQIRNDGFFDHDIVSYLSAKSLSELAIRSAHE